MKILQLTHNYVTKLDDEDFVKFSKYKWYAALDSGTNTRRAARRFFYKGKKSKILFLSRLIIDANDEYYVDHINGDTLDNRKSNLRLASVSQNGMNRGPNKNNKSGYKGVSWSSGDKGWTAHINKTINGKYKQFFIGNFKTKEEAAIAYNKKAKELFGEFAYLNQFK